MGFQIIVRTLCIQSIRGRKLRAGESLYERLQTFRMQEYRLGHNVAYYILTVNITELAFS